MPSIDVCDHEGHGTTYRIKAEKVIINREDGYTKTYEDVYILLTKCADCGLVKNFYED